GPARPPASASSRRHLGMRAHRADAAHGVHRLGVRRAAAPRLRRTVPPDAGPHRERTSRLAALRAVDHLHERSASLVRGGALRADRSCRPADRRRSPAAADRFGASLPRIRRCRVDGGARVRLVVAMIEAIAVLAQTLAFVALAPALAGFIRWMKARLQGRQGAPVWQPYADLRKLFAKERVVSKTASWIFRAAPFVVFGTSVAVASLVPLVFVPTAYDRIG